MASNLWKQNRSPKSTLSGTLTSWQKKPEDVQRLQGLVSFLRISYFMLIHHDSTYGIAYKFDVSFHAKQITRASHPERQGRVHCQVKGFGYWCQPPLHSLNDEFITQIKCLLGNRLTGRERPQYKVSMVLLLQLSFSPSIYPTLCLFTTIWMRCTKLKYSK